jgi:tetratricopeptide (TPR) repeat protein
MVAASARASKPHARRRRDLEPRIPELRTCAERIRFGARGGRSLLVAAAAAGFLWLARQCDGSGRHEAIERLDATIQAAEDRLDLAGSIAGAIRLAREYDDVWAAKRVADQLERCGRTLDADEWVREIAGRLADGFGSGRLEDAAAASLLVRVGRESEALELLDEAVSRSRFDLQLRLERAALTERLHGPESARSWLDAIDASNGRRGVGPELTGDFESDHGRHAAAESAWLSQLTRDGFDLGIPPAVDAVIASRTSGRFGKELTSSRAARLIAKIGLGRLGMGDFARAEPLLAIAGAAARASDSDSPEVAELEARIAMQRGDLEAARRSLTSIRERDGAFGRSRVTERIERLAAELNGAEIRGR